MTRPPTNHAGWFCPSCKAGCAPNVKRCSCAPRSLVTLDALAKSWSLRVETVRAWCRSGKLPAVRIGEGKSGWRVDLEQLERWVDERRVAS